MERRQSTASTVAILLVVASALAAVPGVAATQESQPVEECSTIDEAGVYELNSSVGLADAGNATNGTTTAGNATNDTAGGTGPGEGNDSAAATGNESGATVQTGIVVEDANANACLLIAASNVTLGGNGFPIDGPNASQQSSGNATNTAANASTDANVSATGPGQSTSVSWSDLRTTPAPSRTSPSRTSLSGIGTWCCTARTRAA